MNELKNTPNEGKSKQTSQKERKSRFSVRSVVTGSFLEREGLINKLPFVFFVFGLLLLYIANSYYVEKTVYRIEKYKSEMVELRSEYISSKTRLMTGTNIGNLSRNLKERNVYPSHIPPFKIFVKKNKKNE